ncbi:hypothetical protein ABZ614_33475 [Streptomyces sp. NPDC013178]|uniref:hypothetical protein n=1 Tax=Streptomyces sp. NPDC013178 TaxID=3155118 RepID=UPI0033C09007
MEAGWYPHTNQVGQTGKSVPAAVHRQRHLRRHPAPRRHADLQDRRGQQGPRGPDLRPGRLRRGRRPLRRRPPAHRRDQDLWLVRRGVILAPDRRCRGVSEEGISGGRGGWAHKDPEHRPGRRTVGTGPGGVRAVPSRWVREGNSG